MSLKAKYRTIKSPKESLFKDKGSKHFGYAFSVNSRSEIEHIISELRKTNSKANHVCYAWLLREGDELREYSTDDGEPNNSAGPPILGQLKSSGLQNVLVAVVRYFGGTKLGVSGLINAYKTTTKIVLDKIEPVLLEESRQVKLNYEYAVYNDIIKLVKEQNFKIITEENTSNCKLVIDVPLSKREGFEAELSKLNCNKVEWES